MAMLFRVPKSKTSTLNKVSFVSPKLDLSVGFSNINSGTPLFADKEKRISNSIPETKKFKLFGIRIDRLFLYTLIFYILRLDEWIIYFVVNADWYLKSNVSPNYLHLLSAMF